MTFLNYDARSKIELDKAAMDTVLEFAKHFEQQKIIHPHLNKTQIFEPWAMQRISNLQVGFTNIVQQMNVLDHRLQALEKTQRKPLRRALSSDIPSSLL